MVAGADAALVSASVFVDACTGIDGGRRILAVCARAACGNASATIVHCWIEVAASSLSAIFSSGWSFWRGRFLAHDVDFVCGARVNAGSWSGARGEHRGWAIYVAQRFLCG